MGTLRSRQRDISEGRVRPDHKGRYIVGSGSINKVAPKQVEQPKVTPVAQAVEIAKSELKREEKIIRGRKRKGLHSQGPPGKQLKTLRRENGYRY